MEVLIYNLYCLKEKVENTMFKSRIRITAFIFIGILLLLVVKADAQTFEDSTKLRFMENLGRGMIAINQGNGRVYVGWRLLGTDPNEIAFNLYRSPYLR